jgi:hypothetical protein
MDSCPHPLTTHYPFYYLRKTTPTIILSEYYPLPTLQEKHPTYVSTEMRTLLIYYQRSWQLFKCK